MGLGGQLRPKAIISEVNIAYCSHVPTDSTSYCAVFLLPDRLIKRISDPYHATAYMHGHTRTYSHNTIERKRRIKFGWLLVFNAMSAADLYVTTMKQRRQPFTIPDWHAAKRLCLFVIIFTSGLLFSKSFVIHDAAIRNLMMSRMDKLSQARHASSNNTRVSQQQPSISLRTWEKYEGKHPSSKLSFTSAFYICLHHF